VTSWRPAPTAVTTPMAPPGRAPSDGGDPCEPRGRNLPLTFPLKRVGHPRGSVQGGVGAVLSDRPPAAGAPPPAPTPPTGPLCGHLRGFRVFVSNHPNPRSPTTRRPRTSWPVPR